MYAFTEVPVTYVSDEGGVVADEVGMSRAGIQTWMGSIIYWGNETCVGMRNVAYLDNNVVTEGFARAAIAVEWMGWGVTPQPPTLLLVWEVGAASAIREN